MNHMLKLSDYNANVMVILENKEGYLTNHRCVRFIAYSIVCSDIQCTDNTHIFPNCRDEDAKR